MRCYQHNQLPKSPYFRSITLRLPLTLLLTAALLSVAPRRGDWWRRGAT